MHQNDAFELLAMGKNVFLTGAAGAGKTYLLNRYINYLKEHHIKVAVTASTGIAATHLQGVTLHSWSGIGVKESLTPQDMEKLLATPRIKRNYKNTQVLIIDEISMLHKHQLDMVDKIARYILDTEEPFGGMQVVVCGDFFQLPPIASNPFSDEKQFAFEANAWQEGNFHICYLHEQHRQGDDPLLTILNDIRSGTAGEHTKVPLRTRYKKEPQGETRATRLFARNINVDAMNDAELNHLPGEKWVFTMQSEGWSTLVEGLKKNCLAPEQLTLKLDAEVMFVKNDVMGKYVNGTRGIVIGFDRFDGWPIIKTYDRGIVTARAEAWNYEEHGIIRASITQIPLRLAWAITIHKSQGMTLDAAEMDLGDTFEPGMGYVALSRVRSLSGLKLMNLNEMALKVHPRILQQDNIFKEGSAKSEAYLRGFSESEKIELQTAIRVGRFKGSKTATPITAQSKPAKTEKIPTHIITGEMLKERLSITDITEKRGLSDKTVLGHIEKLKGLKLLESSTLEHLKTMLKWEDFECIFNELNQSADGKLQPVYDKFGGRYSYRDIQLVRLFIAA